MEILFELSGPAESAAEGWSGNAMVAQATRTGDRYRVQVEENGLYQALEKLRAANAKNIVGDASKAFAGRIFHARGGSRAEASGGRGSERKVNWPGKIAI